MFKILRHLTGFLSQDMAIDLGTANTLIFVKGRGIVLNEPSVVAINKDTGMPRAVGIEAKNMIGRTPGNIIAIRPMKDGVIADFEITEAMLRHFIQKVCKSRRLPTWPRIAVCVPSGITAVERRAVVESTMRAGAKKVYIIEEPMAAAIGAGLPVHEPQGCMIVDIGGGTTEVAVIALGGIVYAKSVRVAGDGMDQSIIQHLKKTYNLIVGERTAEDIKIAIGSAFPLAEEMEMQVKGRDQIMGLPKVITITSEEIRESLSGPVNSIVDAVRVTLERTPPELSADMVDQGVVLAGGGALLRGLDQLVAIETGLHVRIAEDPLGAVVLGGGRFLEELKYSNAEQF